MERAIEIPARSIIAQVADWATELREAASTPGPYALRGAAVERIDAAGLQALLSFRLTVRAMGWAVRWDGVSEKLNAAAHSAGLAGALGLAPSEDLPWH